jgi:broad specificity phosphatase PhoE
MREFLFGLAAAVILASSPAAAQHGPSPVHNSNPQTPGASSQSRVGQLIEQMRAGGHVLVIRHERTEIPSRDDDYTRPASDCAAQRNLSVAGLAGAQETGVALRTLGIPIATVISSPMCRTTETARFMFRDYRIEPRLIHPNPGVPGGRDLDQAAEEFAEILRALPTVDGNTVLISHGGNIFRATGLRLAEGEIGLVRIGADGTVEPLGQVLGSDLGPDARLVLSPTAE